MALVRSQHVLSSLYAFSFASQVEVEEFLMGCLRLRGPATAIDMGKVIRDQNWLVQTVGSLPCFFYFIFVFPWNIFFKHLKCFEISRGKTPATLRVEGSDLVPRRSLQCLCGKWALPGEGDVTWVFQKKRCRVQVWTWGCWCKHGWFVCIYIYMYVDNTHIYNHIYIYTHLFVHVKFMGCIRVEMIRRIPGWS